MATKATKRRRRRNLARQTGGPETSGERKREASNPLSIRTQVMRRDGRLCHYCKDPATTLDHRQPQTRGGKYTLENLVACCVACNADKGRLSYAAFMAALPFVLEERRAWRAVKEAEEQALLRASPWPFARSEPCTCEECRGLGPLGSPCHARDTSGYGV